MLRIIDLPVSELVLDAAAVSDRLNLAAARGDGARVVGLGPVNDRLLVFLEDGPAAGEYRFAPLAARSAAEVVAEARSRYDASFSTVGIFTAADRLWGLFCRTREARS